MTDVEDTWPGPKYQREPYKHVHALGVISLNYNFYEWAMDVLWSYYFGEEAASFVSDKISNGLS